MVKILRNCDPMADCKPVVFMSCFLLIFWLLLSYVTNSYFAIFLMVSNFILIFGCCVSLSGYVVGQLIDNRREAGQLIEVTTISSSQPFVRPPEYPPSYDEAIRFGLQHCRNQNVGDGVVLCIPLENDSRMNPIYVPYGAPVENSHRPIPFSNGIPNIPSYDMISSSAVVSSSSSTPSTEVPRLTAVSDFERSATHTEPYPTIQTLNQLPESRTMNTNTVSTVIPEDSQTLTLSRSNTVCEIDSNLELSGTSSSTSELPTSSQISRVGVSDSCRDTNSSSKKEPETQVQCEKDWKACGTLPTTSQDLEFRRISSSLSDRHSSLSRSLSFPGIK